MILGFFWSESNYLLQAEVQQELRAAGVAPTPADPNPRPLEFAGLPRRLTYSVDLLPLYLPYFALFSFSACCQHKVRIHVQPI